MSCDMMRVQHGTIICHEIGQTCISPNGTMSSQKERLMLRRTIVFAKRHALLWLWHHVTFTDGMFMSFETMSSTPRHTHINGAL